MNLTSKTGSNPDRWVYRDAPHRSVLEVMRDQGLWNGSFTAKEVTLHQLAPYIGKLKSGIVHSLITYFTRPGDRICDPFVGSGVVALEALVLRRRVFANDLSRYAIALTLGKLTAPPTLEEAERKTDELIGHVEKFWHTLDARSVPQWVRAFFHPRTLKEIIVAFDFCKRRSDWFHAACLCGILHHQRPGFLSYPASHMVPYLRSKLFPRNDFPTLYEYRPLGVRLQAKVNRAYKRAPKGNIPNDIDCAVTCRDARRLSFPSDSVDLVLTSPPYYDALDYGRDNRLRLWFLGEQDWRRLDQRLIANKQSYESKMERCMKEIYRVLKRGKHCILIVGEVQQNGKTRDTGSLLGMLAERITKQKLAVECIVEDAIPDVRRSRRGSQTTKIEKIIVLRKTS
jgi:hypothetical protein